MLVIHLINNLGKGGAEKLLVDLLPKLKQNHTEVELWMLNGNNSEPKYLLSLQEVNIKIVDLKIQNIRNPKSIIQLGKYIKSKSSTSIIHAHLFPTLYWLSLAKIIYRFNNPIVLTEHSTQNKRASFRIFRPIEKIIYKKYNAIIGISRTIFKRLQTDYKLQNVHLINNGVDINDINNSPFYIKEELFKMLSLSDNAKLLLMSARFNYPKDHKTFVNALSYLPENYYALIAGDGNGFSDFENYLSHQPYNDRVRLLGFRSDVKKLMKTVDINILSSDYEGMSGVTLEAMAAQIPFLGSDVSGINDIVPNKKFLFEKKNAQQLAEKIMSITTDPLLQKQMIKEGLEKVKEFDMSIMVENYINLYKSLV